MKAIILVEPGQHPLGTVHGVVLVNDDEADDAIDTLRAASPSDVVFEIMTPDTLESTAGYLSEL